MNCAYHPSTDDHSPNGHVIQISGFFCNFLNFFEKYFWLFLAVFGYFLIFLTPEYEYSYPGDQFWFNKSFRRQLFGPKMANFVFDFFLCPTQKPNNMVVWRRAVFGGLWRGDLLRKQMYFACASIFIWG